MRRLEVEGDALIERLAVRGANLALRRAPGLWQPADQGAGQLRHGRPGDANDADAALACRRGDRGDRFGAQLTAWHGQVCRGRTCAGSAIVVRWKGSC